MKRSIYLLIAIFSISIFFTNCKKKETEVKETTLTVETKIMKIDGSTVKVGGVWVYVYNDDVEYDKKTEADGTVTFKCIEPGTYYVEGEYYDAEGDYYEGEIYPAISIKEGEQKTVELVLTH